MHHRRVKAAAPSANAEQAPSVLRVTSTWTPMTFATVPSANLTGAEEGSKPSSKKDACIIAR